MKDCLDSAFTANHARCLQKEYWSHRPYAPALYYFGADQFTYVVQDGSNVDSNVGTVVITVNFSVLLRLM